jgi:hypothetical protein
MCASHLEEENKVRVLQNREEVAAEWRKLHHEELHTWYSTLFIKYYYDDQIKNRAM